MVQNIGLKNNKQQAYFAYIIVFCDILALLRQQLTLFNFNFILFINMHNILEALIYFFKNLEAHPLLQLDRKTFITKLGQFGVSLADLEKILLSVARWVSNQSQVPSSTSSQEQTQFHTLENYPVQPHTGVRIFDQNECAKISHKSRIFLVKIEEMGILTPQMRECVIDQLMQAEVRGSKEVQLSLTKWITFQTLFHDATPLHLACLERLLFADRIEVH